MSSPLVSVIIPCYNAAQYINQAIQSVINQTYKNIEIVIINDGSTDETEEKVLSIDYNNMKYLRQNNRGQSAASNVGVKNASGDFVKFLDADDILNPEHIGMQVLQIANKSDALSLCSWARFYNNDLSTNETIVDESWKDSLPLEWIKCNMRGLYDMMPGWGWLIPKTLFEKSGGWNETLTLNNDFEFSIRLALHSSYIYFAPNAVLYYRSAQRNSLSSNTSLSSYRSAIHSAKLGCSYLLARENTVETRLLCANKFSYWLYRLYPYYPDLVKELEYEVAALGGTSRKIDESPLMHFLHTTLGWKTAKKIKMAAYSLGYEKYMLAIKKRFFPPSISRR